MKFTVYSLQFIAGILVSMVLCMGGCQKKEEVKTQELQAIPVKVAKVELKDISRALDYVGNIKAKDEAVVYPKVSGKIIEKIKEDGSFVEKGDIIAYIDRDETGLKFEKAPIESPLQGIVGRVYVAIGSSVTPETPIALVVSMDKVKITLNIPEKYIPEIFLNQKAEIFVDAYPDKRFIGNVTKISPVLDIDTRSAPIEITIDNNGHFLKSGMFARAHLILKENKNVPVVIKEAIIGKAPYTYLYLVKNNKAILKKVELGIRQNEYFEVRDGLKEGDLVVIMGQQRLKDGVEVRIEEETSDQRESRAKARENQSTETKAQKPENR